MIIVLAIRPPLGPLSLIIFTAKFLPDRRIRHIEEAEDKTTQMGEVGHPPSRPLYRRKEFNEAENDDKVFGRDGKQKVDVDEPIGKEPTEGEK